MSQQQPASGGAATAAPVTQHIWWSGKLMPWNEATVHVTSVGWPALSAVFEGIRGYWNPERESLFIFRMDAHLARFWRSMRFMHLHPRWSARELTLATAELLRTDQARGDVYLQPMAFTLGGTRGNQPMAEQDAEIYIHARPAPSQLGTCRPVKVCVSSWTRIHEAVLPPRIKAIVNYQNSRLGGTEATRGGYDMALFLNEQGKVAEGGGSCIFMVREHQLITPPITAGILESVTRASVMELAAKELGLTVVERDIDRSEMYFADEAFFCGTMAELTPVASVDGFEMGEGRSPGHVTTQLSELFERVVRGNVLEYRHWLEEVRIG
ncbi:MAG TPA: branched-chain amino acid transaminase [Bacillota bacterium]|nr:branched-chain amino acid transaminase [Bacillota bacterium]